EDARRRPARGPAPGRGLPQGGCRRMVKCLGIFRELQNSPNRESDDALILKAVMENLQLQRVEATLLEPEAADAADLSQWDMIIPMCESSARLSRLDKLARP